MSRGGGKINSWSAVVAYEMGFGRWWWWWWWFKGGGGWAERWIKRWMGEKVNLQNVARGAEELQNENMFQGVALGVQADRVWRRKRSHEQDRNEVYECGFGKDRTEEEEASDFWLFWCVCVSVLLCVWGERKRQREFHTCLITKVT